MKHYGIVGLAAGLVLAGLVGWTAAQRSRSSRGGSSYRSYNVRGDWPADPDYPEDAFTFVRIEYTSGGGYSRRYGYG